MRQARNKVERANVAPHTDGFYVAAIHTDVAYDVEGDTNWRDVVKYDTRTFKNILAGEIGEIHKIRFVKTTENLIMAGSGSAGSGDIYQTHLFGREAFGVSEFEDVDIVVKNPAPASAVNGYATAGYYLAFATRALEASAHARIETVSTWA